MRHVLVYVCLLEGPIAQDMVIFGSPQPQGLISHGILLPAIALDNSLDKGPDVEVPVLCLQGGMQFDETDMLRMCDSSCIPVAPPSAATVMDEVVKMEGIGHEIFGLILRLNNDVHDLLLVMFL